MNFCVSSIVKLRFTTAACLAILLPSLAHGATPGCVQTEIEKLIQASAHATPELFRAQLIAQLLQNEIPSFLKKTPSGREIPVVLMNAQTLEPMRDFIQKSYGTQVLLDPTEPNDHGMLREGPWVIDVGGPGPRRSGEINSNQLGWRDLFKYLPRWKPGHEVLLEVAYELHPDELAAVDYYHRTRRASIFRVKFFQLHREQRVDYPEMIPGVTEHCYTFAKASTIESQIHEISRKLNQMGVPQINAFLREPEVRAYLSRVKERLSKSDPEDAAQLNQNLLTQNETPATLSQVVPSHANVDSFLGWLTAYDSSTQYMQVVKSLNVTGSFGTQDMVNPRATAVLIYDTGDRNQSFKDATYSSYGRTERWDSQQQRPLQNENKVGP